MGLRLSHVEPANLSELSGHGERFILVGTPLVLGLETRYVSFEDALACVTASVRVAETMIHRIITENET